MISIIIPVYNTTKERVDDCLNSIFVQQDSKKEVILIDDGSEDMTSEIIDTFGFNEDEIILTSAKEGIGINIKN